MPSIYSSAPRRATPSPSYEPDPWVPLGLVASVVVLKLAAKVGAPVTVAAAHAAAAGLGPQEDRR